MPVEPLPDHLMFGGMLAEHRKHSNEAVADAVPVSLVMYVECKREELEDASRQLVHAQDAAMDFFDTADEYQAMLERISADPTKVLASQEKPFVKKIAAMYLKHADAVQNCELAEEALADKDMTASELKAEFRKEHRKMQAKMAKMEEELAFHHEVLRCLYMSGSYRQLKGEAQEMMHKILQSKKGISI